MKREKEAISGTVTGNDQHVGFRAMIMKQAIEYNLAGFTKNLPNDVVNFTLQGDAKRLTDALSAIQEGTKRSSDIKVSTIEGTVDPALNAFTIYAWTSTTRNITNPYDLVFNVRSRRKAGAGGRQDRMARHFAIDSERRRPEETAPRRLSSVVWLSWRARTSASDDVDGSPNGAR